MVKRWLLILSLVTNLALASLVVTFGLPWLSERIGGRKYNPAVARDLNTLRRLIYQSEPLHQALEKDRQMHSWYPKELKEVSFQYPHYNQEVIAVGMPDNPIYYSAEHGSGYRLYLKLNWDASLSYDSADRKWIYDPGDGSEGAEIEP
jgi:hypothetical protein